MEDALAVVSGGRQGFDIDPLATEELPDVGQHALLAGVDRDRYFLEHP
jgi:hypothetical protein